MSAFDMYVIAKDRSQYHRDRAARIKWIKDQQTLNASILKAAHRRAVALRRLDRWVDRYIRAEQAMNARRGGIRCEL